MSESSHGLSHGRGYSRRVPGGTTPLVSVVIAVFNGERHVIAAVESALSQDWPALECIVVDDGSDDRTAALLDTIDDQRLAVIWQPNAGVAAARNVGIQAANGEFVAFLDADDIWLPSKTRMQVALLLRRPEVGLVYAGYTLVDELLRVRAVVEPARGGLDVRKMMLLEADGIGLSATGMARTDILRSVGGFDVGLSTSADLDLIRRIEERSAIAAIAEPLALYRLHSDQMHANQEAFESDMTRILNSAFEFAESDRRRGMANLHTRIALRNLLDHRWRAMARSLRIAFGSDPSRVLCLPPAMLLTQFRRRLRRAAHAAGNVANQGQQLDRITGSWDQHGGTQSRSLGREDERDRQSGAGAED